MFFDNFEKLCESIGTNPTRFTKDVLGLSTSKVTAWKNGSIPKFETLQKIAAAFNVTVGELFDGKKEIVPTESKNDLSNLYKVFSSEEVDFLSSLSRDEAVAYLDSIRKSRQK
ncbi:MAG: helix-turn-helix transcriptional regulator [Ruminococcus sp.]|nr:helix-turn-helix transcriptional regulator [Ruminococcus sp.]